MKITDVQTAEIRGHGYSTYVRISRWRRWSRTGMWC
jgi:hypothetical protein